MKAKTLTILSLILLLGFSAQAQKVKEKDILGTWKLKIDVEKELDEEADEAETILEEAIIKGVSSFVTGIIDNIEIYFEFERDGELELTVKAFDEVERERGTWYINKRGYLVIDDIDNDSKKFNISADNDEWKLVDGLLINDDDDDTNVYMTRVD